MKKSIFMYFHNKFDFIGENLQVASSLNDDEMKLFKGIQNIEKLVKQQFKTNDVYKNGINAVYPDSYEYQQVQLKHLALENWESFTQKIKTCECFKSSYQIIIPNVNEDGDKTKAAM